MENKLYKIKINDKIKKEIKPSSARNWTSPKREREREKKLNWWKDRRNDKSKLTVTKIKRQTQQTQKA